MVFLRFLLVTMMLFLVSACSAPNASDLIGTWDYQLEGSQGDDVIADFQREALIGSADEVVLRLGFDDRTYWLGYVFDGELFLLGGVPEGDGGPLESDGDKLILTGAHGEIRATYRWELDGDKATFTWLEQCWLSSNGDDCTDDRTRMAQDDPFTIPLWENTFTKSSEDPSY